MPTQNHPMYDLARSAILALYEDRDISATQTLQGLQSLQEEIATLIETLEPTSATQDH